MKDEATIQIALRLSGGRLTESPKSLPAEPSPSSQTVARVSKGANTDSQFTGASCVVILPPTADGANLGIGITSR